MNFGMMDSMSGWGGMAISGLMMLFLVAILVTFVVLIAGWFGGISPRNSSPDPLDTLKKRFARGEIDTAEFEDRSRQLRESER